MSVTATSKWGYDQTAGHHGLDKLTHKMSPHTTIIRNGKIKSETLLTYPVEHRTCGCLERSTVQTLEKYLHMHLSCNNYQLGKLGEWTLLCLRPSTYKGDYWHIFVVVLKAQWDNPLGKHACNIHRPPVNILLSPGAQACPTLCDPMNHSTPGFPVHHQLPEFTQTHVHRVGDAIQPSHPLSSPSPPAPNPSQHQGLFQ